MVFDLPKILVAFCVLIFAGSLAHAEDAPDFAAAIAQQARELEATGRLEIAGHTIYGHRFLRDLYLLNGYGPLWDEDNLEALLSAMEGLRNDGLNPDDYVLPEARRYLERRKVEQLTPTEQLELDVLLTEGLIRALYNLVYGKIDPEKLDPNINFARPLEETELAPIIVEHAARRGIESLLDMARPEHASYTLLKQGLQRYRDIRRKGGWPGLAGGKVLKPGARDARVPLLAERLTISGDYMPTVVRPDNELFDEPLVEAIKRFQARHSLEVDGILGPATLTALNISVEQRIEQIRVNLERQRWVLHALEAKSEFIIVDIAGFKVYWIKDDKPTWEQRIQVGRAYTQTPVFKDQIEYIEFNPTWTIPPGILRRSVIPNLKKDPAYINRSGFQLLTLDGKAVDPTSVDWANLRGFPYIVRQPPGPNNAMGLVKFMFPNPHFVFLHDTNNRGLFNRTQRAFSAGCIRVREPFDLAERLLQHQAGWNRARIDDVIASGRTRRVNLDKPMPIIIGYGTAVGTEDGVNFRPDVYERDPKVLKALDAPFSFRKRDR